MLLLKCLRRVTRFCRIRRLLRQFLISPFHDLFFFLDFAIPSLSSCFCFFLSIASFNFVDGGLLGVVGRDQSSV